MLVARAVERCRLRASMILKNRLAACGRLLAFDVIEAELVNDQQIEAGVITHPLGQGLVGQRGGQVFEQAGAGGVADGVAQRTQALWPMAWIKNDLPTPLWPTKTRLSRRRMKAPVASSSIWTRSMAERLNSQSKALKRLERRGSVRRGCGGRCCVRGVGRPVRR